MSERKYAFDILQDTGLTDARPDKFLGVAKRVGPPRFDPPRFGRKMRAGLARPAKIMRASFRDPPRVRANPHNFYK